MNKKVLTTIFKKYDDRTLFATNQERNTKVFKEVLDSINIIKYEEKPQQDCIRLEVMHARDTKKRKVFVLLYLDKAGKSKIIIDGKQSVLKDLLMMIKDKYHTHLNPPDEVLCDMEALFG